MRVRWAVPSVTRIMDEELRLRRVARRLVGSDADADTVVRDALALAYLDRHRCPGGDVASWTTRILYRCLLAARHRLGAEVRAAAGRHAPVRRPATPGRRSRLVLLAGHPLSGGSRSA